MYSFSQCSVFLVLSGSKTYLLCQSLKEAMKNMKKKEDNEHTEKKRAIFFLTAQLKDLKY